MSAISPKPHEHLTKSSQSNGDRFSNLFSVDNVWKIAVLAFMAANLYLQQNYTSKVQFDKIDDRVKKIELVLAQLEIKNQIDATQNSELQSLDSRLRDLERTSAILMQFHQEEFNNFKNNKN